MTPQSEKYILVNYSNNNWYEDIYYYYNNHQFLLIDYVCHASIKKQAQYS